MEVLDVSLNLGPATQFQASIDSHHLSYRTKINQQKMIINNDLVTAPRGQSSKRRRRQKLNPNPDLAFQLFQFLKLPVELRNQIYQLALVSDDPIQLTVTIKHNRRQVAVRSKRSILHAQISHNILHTCKQIYYEAAPVLYGQPLEFLDPYGHGQGALMCFLSQIGKHGVRMLKTIVLDTVKVGKVSAFTHPVFTALVDAINLKELRINRLHEGNHRSTFPDADVGKLAQFFFPVAHIWIEQMIASPQSAKPISGMVSREVVREAIGRMAHRNPKRGQRHGRLRQFRPFPFLRLPAELRNRIYEFSLESDDDLLVTDRLQKSPRRRVACRYYHRYEKALKKHQADVNPNLLLVCKQVHFEAVGILYTQPIKFMSLDGLFCFLSQIGKNNIENLRDISIETMSMGRDGQMTEPAFTALLNAKNLESLNICSIERRFSEREYVPCDHGLGDIAASFFAIAHVWMEQMRHYRTDGKSWKDVLVLAHGGRYKAERGWPGEMFEFHDGENEFTKDDFFTEMRKVMKG
ncbi:hypothetical protein FKW77_010464 [Venturia effusa]|uniref:2EXR domain-containing protein n=1 Tax=Venturia effusa TaxID=50376 RepID=A0A517KXR1_9PEZI|nr:hypothetical protein FKW77_010464 [Venturia effusa]